MPTKRNMKNRVLVEVIQPKDYMTLVNEKLDNNTKQLILNHISLMKLKEQAQSTHTELMSWKNKFQIWACANCPLHNRRAMKCKKTFEYIFGYMNEKQYKKMLQDRMKKANRK